MMLRIAVVTYITFGIVAFGHSAGTPSPDCYVTYNNIARYDTTCQAAGGFTAGLAWPLYLSWTLWQ